MKQTPFLLPLLLLVGTTTTSLLAFPMEKEGSLPSNSLARTRAAADARADSSSDTARGDNQHGVDRGSSSQVVRGTVSGLAEEKSDDTPDFSNIIKENLREQFLSNPTTVQDAEGVIVQSNEESSAATAGAQEEGGFNFPKVIKDNLKQQFLAELALETLQDAEAAANRLSTAYNTLPEFKKTFTKNAMALAEKALVRAQEADLTARAARKKAYEMNFEREWSTYKAAEQAWDEAIIAYTDLKDAFQNNPTLLAPLEQYLDNAEVREALWKAYEPWINARKMEQKIAAATVFIKADAEEARDCWNEVVEDYTRALSKARKAALNDMTLVADLDAATVRSAIWSEKIAELDEMNSRAPIDFEAQEQARLDAVRKNHQATIEAIHKEQYQRSYHQWPLPGELGDVSTSATAELQERNSEEILPAKISEKELAALGKELFKKERRARAVAAAQAARAVSSTATEHKSAPVKTTIPVLTASELAELAHSEIIIASLQLSPENEARWAAREKADQLLLEAVKVATAKKNALGAIQELFETDENKRAAFSSFPTNLSVIDEATSIFYQTERAHADKAARDLQKAMDAASIADSAWEELVHQAEKMRMDHGGRPLDFSDAIEFWEEADKKASLAKKEKEKNQKKELIAAAHKEDWQGNTARWEARMRANQCNRQANEAEEQADDLLQEQARINLKDGLRSKNAKRISEEVVAAKETAATTRASATEAEEQWSSLAKNHRSVIAFYAQGVEAIKAALEKLKSSDQSVSNLWYEVISRHSDDEFKEEKDPTKEQAAINKEATLYKTNLLTERAALITECFRKVDEELAATKKKYERSQAPEKKEAAKLLYDAIDEQEIVAQKTYAKKSATAALKAAREKKPEETWEHRLTQSEKEKMTQEKTVASTPPATETWADEPQRLLARATEITESDRKACKVFEKEKKRLIDIGLLWEEIIGAKKKADHVRRENAAQAYANGDRNAWSTFTPEEREQYDQDVILADKTANEEIAAAIAQAAEAAKLARAQVRMVPSALFIKAAQKAQAILSRLQDQESERQRAIEVGAWIKLSPEERKAELEKRMTAARAKEEAAARYSDERTHWHEALDYWQQATEADAHEEYEHFLFWKKAVEQEEASARYHHEAALSETSGSVDNAKLWRVSAQQSHILAERYAQVIPTLDSESEARRKINNADQFAYQSAINLKESAQYLRSAVTTDVTGTANADKAKLWRLAAEKTQKLSEYEQSIATWIDRVEECFSNFRWAGFHVYLSLESADCLTTVVNYLKKAADANNPEISFLWDEAAQATYYLAERCYEAEQVKSYHSTLVSLLFALQKVQQKVFIAEFTGKKTEAEKEGEHAVANEWNRALEASKVVLQLLSDIKEKKEDGKTNLASNAWYCMSNIREDIVKLMVKAIEAEVAEKPEIAKAWREAIQLKEYSSENFFQSAKAIDEEKTEEGQSWGSVGTVFNLATNMLGEAIEAEEMGKPEIAKVWRVAVQLHERSAEFLSQAVKARVQGKLQEGESWKTGGSGFFEAAEKLGKSIKAEEDGKSEIAKVWQESVLLYERSTKFFSQAVEAFGKGKTEEGNSWNGAGIGFYSAAEKRSKAIEAEEAGTSETAKSWREAAQLQERSNEFYVQAAKAFDKGKTEEGNNWQIAASGFFDGAQKLGKAIEAEEEGKPKIAKSWREAAQLQERSNEFYVQAAKAFDKGKTEEGNNWQIAGSGFYNAAEKLSKAIEEEEAKAWREIARLYECTNEFLSQAKRAYAQGQTEEGDSWQIAGRGFYNAAEKLDKAFVSEAARKPTEQSSSKSTAQLQERSNEFFVQTTKARAQKKIEEGNSWQIAGSDFYNETERLSKAIEEEIAKAWREVARLYESSNEFFVQTARAYAQGKKEEGEDWKITGSSFYNAAEKLGKAIEEEAAGRPEIAKAWRVAASLQERSGEFFVQAVRAFDKGKTEEDYSWKIAGRGFYNAAEQLGKAIEEEAAGRPEIAKAWRVAASLQERSNEFFVKAAKSYAQGKIGEGESWSQAGLGFYNAAENLGKAIEAEVAENPKAAKAYREAAVLQERSNEFFVQAARAYAQGKTEEGESWYNAGHGFGNAAEKLGKAIEAEVAGRPEIAKAWREAVVLQESSNDFFVQAVKAFDKGQKEEGNSWQIAGRGFYNAAENLGKAIEAEAARKPAMAKAWREAAVLKERSNEFFVQAARAYAQEKVEEGQNWYNIGGGFYNAAERLEKAIEVEATGKAEIAKAWREAAILQERSSEFFVQAAKVFNQGKAEKLQSWVLAALSFNSAAEKLGKAIESEEEGKANAAKTWREAAALQERSSEFFVQAAKAFDKEKKREGESWFNAGGGFYSAAEKRGEAIEVEAAGKPEIVNAWREAAQLQEQANEFYVKAAKAFDKEKVGEGNSWNGAGFGFYSAAENLGKGIEAEAAGKPEEACLWHEAAKKQEYVGQCYITTATAHIDAGIAKDHALFVNPKNPELFNAAWDKAIQKSAAVEVAWNQVLQAIHHREDLPQAQQADGDVHLNEAKYCKTLAAIQSHKLEALKADKIAKAAKNKALTVSPAEAVSFKKVWNEAIQTAQATELAWNQVVEAYTRARETISQAKQVDWDANLHEAQYWKARYAAQPLWLEAIKISKIAEHAEARARGVDPKETKNFKDTWDAAIVGAHTAEQIWNQVVQSYTHARGTIPLTQQEEWGAGLKSAQHQKDYYAAQSALLEAARVEKQGT